MLAIFFFKCSVIVSGDFNRLDINGLLRHFRVRGHTESTRKSLLFSLWHVSVGKGLSHLFRKTKPARQGANLGPVYMEVGDPG